jgi:hypothetical protein
MTLEQKNEVLNDYCCGRMCRDCVLNNGWCDTDDGTEESLDKALKLIATDATFEMGEKSCNNCKFTDKEVNEEPCINCQNNFVAGTKEFDDHDLLWQSMNSVEKESKPNNVNHPSHYNNGGMECIDEMILIFGKVATMYFCLCNAWKYRYRANAKNGQEDLDKANWYIAKYKELKEELPNE